MATPGANISKDEKRGRPIIPTFPYIRATSFFTNGMQAMRIHQLTDFLVMGSRPETDFEPGREVSSPGWLCGRSDGSNF
jgi:hypothetical protein